MPRMAAPRMLVQAQLRSGSTIRTCWIEPIAKPGDVITLRNSEDPARLWDVTAIGAPYPAACINRGWDNNI